MENKIELNAEQIKKALECCDGTMAGCDECPYYEKRYCCPLNKNSLSLINSEVKSRNIGKEKLLDKCVDLEDKVKADTVRKMQQNVKELFAPDDDVQEEIDRIEKKIAEGEE